MDGGRVDGRRIISAILRGNVNKLITLADPSPSTGAIAKI